MNRKINRSTNTIIKPVSFFIMCIFIMTAFMPLTQIGLSAPLNQSGIEITINGYTDNVELTYHILGYDIETIMSEGKEYKRYFKHP